MNVEEMIRQKFRQLKTSMDERVRRLWAGAEAEAIGRGGIAAVARATGLAISTVTLGRNELRAGARADKLVKVRRKGGGRRRHEAVHPELVPALEKLVDPVTRGDPESPLRWTCKSTRALSAEMFTRYGLRVGNKTVARLLRDRGYSLAPPPPAGAPCPACALLMSEKLQLGVDLIVDEIPGGAYVATGTLEAVGPRGRMQLVRYTSPATQGTAKAPPANAADRWGVGPWVGVGTDGLSVGLAVAPPAWRVPWIGWQAEFSAGAGVARDGKVSASAQFVFRP